MTIIKTILVFIGIICLCAWFLYIIADVVRMMVEFLGGNKPQSIVEKYTVMRTIAMLVGAACIAISITL